MKILKNEENNMLIAELETIEEAIIEDHEEFIELKNTEELIKKNIINL